MNNPALHRVSVAAHTRPTAPPARLARRLLAVAHRWPVRTRRPSAGAGWGRAASDPAGLQRWWNGRFWTTFTQWDFNNAIRADGRFYRHGSCTIRHHTPDAAARCPSRR